MSSIKIELRQEDVAKIKEICASFNNNPQELINVLHKCQEHFGYLPAEVQEVASMELGVPVAKIYGVVTFYSFFTMTPKGRHPISICMGTACYVRGAEKVLEEFKKELAMYRNAGTVWISYAVPFIIPITAGLITAIVFGDILFAVMKMAAGGI